MDHLDKKARVLLDPAGRRTYRGRTALATAGMVLLAQLPLLAAAAEPRHKAVAPARKPMTVAAPTAAPSAAHQPVTRAAPAARATTAGTTASGLEEVTVTSERRSQSAQSLGSSVSVISAQTLAARNVNNVFDLQYLTPSLQVTPQFGSGQPAFTIRGVGFNDYASDNAPTVGVYMDEVASPVPFATNGLMFDIARVEVLRGPQGTLYGRNTTGGAINYILNKPTDHFSVGVNGQYGSYNAAKVDGYISGPITDKIKVRLSGEEQSGGAWQFDGMGGHLGDVQRGALRLLVEAQATDTLKVSFNLHGSIDHSDGGGTHLFTPLTSLQTYVSPTSPVYPADTNRDITHWGTSSQYASLIGISRNQKPFHHIDVGGMSLRLDQQFSFATLTELASYDVANRQEYDNFDGSSLNIADVYFNTRANVFSNELRLTSRAPGPLTWVAGIYYSNQYLSDQYISGFESVYGFNRGVFYSQKVDTVSGFGQLSWKINDKWTLTGGIRGEYEHRQLDNFRAYSFQDSIAAGTMTAYQARRNYDYAKPSGKVELQYRPIHNDMLYISASHGVKSGGFTTYNTADVQRSTTPFKPEQLWAYEIGNKFDLPREHLRFNLSAFYYDYHNEQIQSATVNPQTGLVGAIVNAPRSHLAGGEYEIDWSPLPGLLVSQSGGWAVGQFDRFSSIVKANLVNGVFVGEYRNRKGDSLPAPKLTFNGSVSYKWRMGRYDLTTGMNYSIRSTYRSLFGSLYDVAGYSLWGATMSFGPRDGKWSISAFGNNIFDKKYDVERNYFVNGTNIAMAGMPATWGVRAGVNF
ncbi:TonB-dependent receptor [Ameyamaea chiangmaiensis]|nr:TonB-dependent receptor [Ameyamaea chiangmaiensis]